MVITKDEILVLIEHYEDLIEDIDRRIDDIENSEASALLDRDIIVMQIHPLISLRVLKENRLKKLKSYVNHF